ncbi:hypothetical protein LTR36_002781 [Oleoguttula mirabilis]|uniref:EF-hand domain-containing protein n=1 Tax=Oleoguttula mirabilis TaxID=1507867 RepID=A0AAV9JK93_9PEZI|nr:hypothetical protein LTR36_002781 [Oleoguttula mirabilis]
MSNRPLSLHDTGRQSPFRRQNSASPATVKAATPTSSPTKVPSSTWSPAKASSLSPEKTSPFVRRPSQINGHHHHNSNGSERAASPFARPTSGLSLGVTGSGSPSRNVSYASNMSSGSGEVVREVAPRPLPATGRRASPPRAIEEPDVPTPMSMATAIPTPSSPAIPHNTLSSPSPFDSPALDSPSISTTEPRQATHYPASAADSPSTHHHPTQAHLRPTAYRTTTSSSTVSTVKAPPPPPIFNPSPSTNTKPSATATRLMNNMNALNNSNSNGYTHIPHPLLRSMREAFEVLDTANTGSVNSASIASMLEQMGMDATPTSLRDFFPPGVGPAQLNLARYLDTLSSPMSALSHPDELAAAFEAFDLDDSGQIDVAELRNAVLHTAPEPGESDMVRLSEREVDSILGEFASRRAFGAKGVNVAKGKGEVFRYRDFMAGISGGSGDGEVAGGMGGGGAAAEAGAMAV